MSTSEAESPATIAFAMPSVARTSSLSGCCRNSLRSLKRHLRAILPGLAGLLHRNPRMTSQSLAVVTLCSSVFLAACAAQDSADPICEEGNCDNQDDSRVRKGLADYYERKIRVNSTSFIYACAQGVVDDRCESAIPAEFTTKSSVSVGSDWYDADVARFHFLAPANKEVRIRPGQIGLGKGSQAGFDYWIRVRSDGWMELKPSDWVQSWGNLTIKANEGTATGPGWSCSGDGCREEAITKSFDAFPDDAIIALTPPSLRASVPGF